MYIKVNYLNHYIIIISQCKTIIFIYVFKNLFFLFIKSNSRIKIYRKVEKLNLSTIYFISKPKYAESHDGNH